MNFMSTGYKVAWINSDSRWGNALDEGYVGQEQTNEQCYQILLFKDILINSTMNIVGLTMNDPIYSPASENSNFNHSYCLNTIITPGKTTIKFWA